MDIAELRRKFFGGEGYRSKSWATNEEAQILHDYVKNNGVETVVEIGTASGFTASCMALAGATVYTFDPFDRPKIYDHPQFPDKTVKDRVIYKALSSPDCLTGLVPKGKTLWFIDGSHTYEDVIADFEKCHSLSKPGDFIFFHDILNSMPTRKAWDTIKLKFPADKVFEFQTAYGFGLLCV